MFPSNINHKNDGEPTNNPQGSPSITKKKKTRKQKKSIPLASSANLLDTLNPQENLSIDNSKPPPITLPSIVKKNKKPSSTPDITLTVTPSLPTTNEISEPVLLPKTTTTTTTKTPITSSKKQKKGKKNILTSPVGSASKIAAKPHQSSVSVPLPTSPSPLVPISIPASIQTTTTTTSTKTPITTPTPTPTPTKTTATTTTTLAELIKIQNTTIQPKSDFPSNTSFTNANTAIKNNYTGISISNPVIVGKSNNSMAPNSSSSSSSLPLLSSSTFSKPTTNTTTTTTTTTTSSGNSSRNVVERSSSRRIKDDMVQGLPKRVGPASDFGKSVELYVNQYQVNFGKFSIYQYQIEFVPELFSRKSRYNVLRKIGDKLPLLHVFDGVSLFWCLESFSFKNIRLPDGVGSISLTQTNVLSSTDKQGLQFLNVLMKKPMMAMNLKLIGRNYFDFNVKNTINTLPVFQDAHVQMLSGFFVSMVNSKAGLSLIVDPIKKFQRTSTILEEINILKKNNNNNSFEESIRDLVCGRIVFANYGSKKTYRVDSVDFKGKVTDKMSADSDTFEDYYSRNYNLKITDKSQCLLKVKEGVYLIPEFCTLTGMSNAMRENRLLKEAIDIHRRQDPIDKFNGSNGFISNITTKSEPSKILNDWNLSFGPPSIVLGTIIPKPKIDYSQLMNVLLGLKWSVVYPNSFDEPKEFINAMVERYSLCKPTFVTSIANPISSDSYTKEIKEMDKRSKVDIYLIVLPRKQTELYNRVKKDITSQGIKTQLAIHRTISFSKNIHSVAKNIASQVAGKVGRVPWSISESSTINSFKTFKRIMVVGVDVNHNNDNRTLFKSVVGFVSTTNNNFTLFHSQYSFQKCAGKEIIQSFKPLMCNAISAYKSKNQGLSPQLVIVYRDGVGDDMIQLVMDNEIKDINQAFQEFDQSEPIKLIHMVVKKNTNTRFMVKMSKENPESGTLIESGCTRQNWNDFFLTSHRSSLGAINPTHYNIIYDNTDGKITTSDLQKFTFHQCFLYYNTSNPVSVPATAYYSHKIAYFIGRVINCEVNDSLSSSLYYL